MRIKLTTSRSRTFSQIGSLSSLLKIHQNITDHEATLAKVIAQEIKTPQHRLLSQQISKRCFQSPKVLSTRKKHQLTKDIKYINWQVRLLRVLHQILPRPNKLRDLKYLCP